MGILCWLDRYRVKLGKMQDLYMRSLIWKIKVINRFHLVCPFRKMLFRPLRHDAILKGYCQKDIREGVWQDGCMLQRKIICLCLRDLEMSVWVLFGFVSRVQVDVVRRIKKYQGKNCWNLPKKGLQNQPSFWQRHIYH